MDDRFYRGGQIPTMIRQVGMAYCQAFSGIVKQTNAIAVQSQNRWIQGRIASSSSQRPASLIIRFTIQLKASAVSKSNTFYLQALMGSAHKLILFPLLFLAISSAFVHEFQSAIASSLDELAHIARNVERRVSSQLRMTTRQLTLNLSAISFPNPARQGDNLNLSAIRIPGAVKCGEGYIMKGNTCQLADLLMMQDLDAQNLIVGSLNLEELRTKQQQFIQNNPTFTPIKCAGQKPFLGKQGCISCLDPYPYFNLETFKCAKCPEGSSYCPEAKNCQKGGNDFLSNLENKNYLVLPNKPLSEYREEYKKLKEQNSDLQTCPDDKPFSIGGECIQCPQDRPLFFLPARTCTKCRKGSTFDSESNSCIAAAGEVTKQSSRNRTDDEEEEEEKSRFGRERWTVEKGLANIFGWNKNTTSDMIDRARDLQSSNEATAKRGRRVATTSTTTRTTSREVRKETDAQDEPQKGSSSATSTNSGGSTSGSRDQDA